MNKLLFTLILFGIFTISKAQKPFLGGLEVGIMGTQVDGDSLSGYDKAGLRLGGFVERQLTTKLSVITEILYTQKGSKSKRNNDDFSSFYEINLQYFEIPLMMRYYDKSGFFGEGGLAFGYLYKSYEQGYDKSQLYRKIEGAGFNKFEISWHVGVGYKVFERTYIHTMFGYSLFKVRGKYNSEIPGIRAGQYNNTLTVSIQVYLGKNK